MLSFTFPMEKTRWLNTTATCRSHRIVPADSPSAREKPAIKLDVQVLPPRCDDPAFVMSLNDKPGILALAMEKKDGKLEALPFIVPGARFNEKYGWDSVSLEWSGHS